MKIKLGLIAAALFCTTWVNAHQAGDIIVRMGSATVRPNTGSDDVLGQGAFHADNNTQLGLTLGYMATDNIGVELLAATPFKHHISLNGAAVKGEIASVRDLPPTLMAQYYFGNVNSTLRPYLGVGVNYTTFFNQHFNDDAKGLGLHDLKMKGSWGVAGQAGLDFNLDEHWLLNASLWWINIDSRARFSQNNTPYDIKTRLDPWVFMFGAGYRF